jgi:hypothetical protein
MIRAASFLFILGASVSSAQNVAFVNGLWFDGRTFVPRTAYAVNGDLTFRGPAHIGSTIDLSGGYVLPPFGEAHNHNVEPTNNIGLLVERYLRHGIFYVKNPDCLPYSREQLTGRVNTPTTIDVSFSNGGFTGSDGHPLEIEKRNIERGIWTTAQGEGAFYYVVDDGADLDRKWPQHMATKPDFIKTYLLYSEEYKARKMDAAFFGWKGLDPSLLKTFVAKAHAAGLRVSTHIESAADFHNALEAGVDEINHMPGFRMHEDVRPHPASAFELSPADAQLAVRQGTFVVTTLGGARALNPNGPDAAKRMEQDALNSRNLQLLYASGVKIAIGSDSYRVDSLPEALYLESLHALDNLSLLKIWCESTVQTIFPRRKLGFLKEGYEANFIVLDGDPLTNFANVGKIRLRVKRGDVISLPAEETK